LGYTLFYFSVVTAVSREVMVASQKDHISVPISDSTERLNEEKGDSSRSGSGSSSPEIWVPPAIKMVHSEQKDDVNTSDQSENLNAENNGQLTLNDNSPCPEETEINSSDQIGKELTVNT
jgi:phosphatidate phosphatase PAH1